MKDQPTMPTLTLPELRKNRGLTQQAVADRLDKTQSYINRLEKRDNVTAESLARYIQALGGKMTIVVSFDDAEFALPALDI